MIAEAVTAAAVFAGTNVDDLLVLTVLNLSARATGRPRPGAIWLGQYLGVGALVAASAVGALGLVLVPDRWVGLLGVIPLALGVRGLAAAVRGGHADGPPPVAAGALAVAGVTVANGADNLAVYTPILRTLGWSGTVTTVTVFAALIAVWCLAGAWLGSHPRVVALVERHGRWLVPAVFVAVGAVIIAGAGFWR